MKTVVMRDKRWLVDSINAPAPGTGRGGGQDAGLRHLRFGLAHVSPLRRSTHCPLSGVTEAFTAQTKPDEHAKIVITYD